MKKRLIPLIAMSMFLITSPAYASEKSIDAIVPVSCTAKNSDEEFKVSMNGDSGYQASPEVLYIKDGETGNFSVSFDTPGTYKYTVSQEQGNDSKTIYDKTVYNADIYVTEDDQGVLNAETIVYKNGSSNKLAKCDFVNSVEVETTPAAVTPIEGSDSGVGATEKSSSSSTTSGINTGVITHEGVYALAGLAGITIMFVTAKRRREKK